MLFGALTQPWALKVVPSHLYTVKCCSELGRVSTVCHSDLVSAQLGLEVLS